MGTRLVILADGTGNTVAGDDSNVLRLCRLLDLSNPSAQIAVYDPGVGTRTTTADLQRALPRGVQFIDDQRDREGTLARNVRWLLGLGFGLGTDRNIRQLYEWLARAYQPGDDVFLFGFSRGAFTARALAGLIYRCGLVRDPTRSRVAEAMSLYRPHYEGARNAVALRTLKRNVEVFRREHARPCTVRFLGIWDTVKSVGYLRPRNLPHTRHNPIVRTVRHAVSLDERRSMYAMTTWGGLDADTRPATFVPAQWGGGAAERPPIEWQDVEEVWFAGNHADVGGGYRAAAGSPADVSLLWMANEARACGLLVSALADEAAARVGGILASQRHDELTRRGTWTDLCWRTWWRAMEWVPRAELDNEPPPPRRMPRWGPAGARRPGDACRGGVVSIHRSAASCYAAREEPWAGAATRFVDTRPASVPLTTSGTEA